jgi:hypothetical protein
MLVNMFDDVYSTFTRFDNAIDAHVDEIRMCQRLEMATVRDRQCSNIVNEHWPEGMWNIEDTRKCISTSDLR